MLKKESSKIKLEGLSIAVKVEVEFPLKSLSVARKAELVGDSPELRRWFEELEQVRKNPEMLNYPTKNPVDLGELKLKEVKRGKNKENGRKNKA